MKFFREKKAGPSLHVCGCIDSIMEDLLNLSIVALSVDSPSSLKRMVEISLKEVAQVSKVATSLFVSGTWEVIEESVKEYVRVAKSDEAFIISSGCELPHCLDGKGQVFYWSGQRLGKN